MDRADYLKVEALGRAMYEHLKGQQSELALAAATEVLCCALLNSQQDPRALNVDKLVNSLVTVLRSDLTARLEFLREHANSPVSEINWFPEEN